MSVQQGLLDLDVPVSQYLPDFSVHSIFESEPAERMTLRHLLSHTAGFTHEAPEGSNYRVGSASFAALCASIGRTWLRCPVGHHFDPTKRTNERTNPPRGVFTVISRGYVHAGGRRFAAGPSRVRCPSVATP
jgi:CubicO group peptidase (beta-lactamase class C family)